MPLPPPPDAPVQLVSTPGDLEVLVGHVAESPRVALDIESNGMHAYRERVCVLQLSAGRRHTIVDAVALADLSCLRDALDHDEVEVVLHGGDYDIASLSRDHDFRFHRVFDTMIAASMLGEEKIGLANLVEDAYGVELDKRFQTADWAKRPLTEEQVEYLHRDTLYLPGLRDLYFDRLASAGILEEAAIEFAHLASRKGRHVELDPNGWRRLKNARGIEAEGRAILAELHLWREAEAERRDRPPFKVLPPSVMVELARKPPRPNASPKDLRAVPPRLRQRYGKALLGVVRRGRARAKQGDAPPAREHPPPTREERIAHQRERQLEDRLKNWRRKAAKERGVTNIVVLPNRALAWIARTRPSSVAALDACADIGPKRAARDGQTIVEIVQSSP